jgi:pimeloyl-ACP methyl ester carboxylesterase
VRRNFHIIALAASLLVAGFNPASAAGVKPFPPSFHTEDVAANGVTLHVRIGGKGPAVVLLHGFGDTGDMWAPLAEVLVKDHTVVVPDLRGMGLSSHPDAGFDKKTEAQDIAALMDRFKIDKAALVTHDIGNMVGYALAAQFPARITRWAVMDAPLPGVGNWADQLSNPKTWHFNFHGPDEERLVAGRERIFLDRFYNELSATPAAIDEATRQHYAALYARTHAMHDALEQFVNFPQDGVDNRAFLAKGKLEMPVLAIGGDHSYGAKMADELNFVAAHVTGASVSNSGHWIMEEQPAQAIALIVPFVEAK